MTQPALLSYLKAQPFVLAPMAAITDRPFRTFMRELGCGIVTSELVSATGLHFASEKTIKLMEFDDVQHPVGIQLFGENLDHLSLAAKKVEQMGADFVDLNFGCPVPKVVKKGAGSACLKDLKHLSEILRAVKKSISIPLTIKVRTGWDESSRNTDEVVKIAFNEGVTWVSIHGRTRAAGYSGLSDWDYISEVKAKAAIPIIGNGDVTSASLAVRRLRESGCDGIMIGRGCLKNPFIFLEAYELWQSGVSLTSKHRNYQGGLKRLFELLYDYYDEKRLLIQMKKFASWYSAGFPGSAEFRKKLFTTADAAAVGAFISEYFSASVEFEKLDTSSEAFLMGGHG